LFFSLAEESTAEPRWQPAWSGIVAGQSGEEERDKGMKC
jgi:hypothetical protein